MARKKRLSYLDYIIIASLLFFAVGLFSRYTLSQRHIASASDVEADIVFELHAVSEDTVRSLLSDTVLYNARGEYFGEIMLDSISATPAKIRRVGQNGRISAVESKTLYDVEAVAVTIGSKTEGGFFLGGVSYLAPNMTVSVRSDCGSFEIYITSIEVY